MENDNNRKTLVPEVLPAPAAITSRTPRQRVTDHFLRLKQLGVVASAAALANCGYMVVDPLPPPAHCSPVPGELLSTHAERVGTDVRFELNFTNYDSVTWTFGAIGSVTGATVQDDQRFGTPNDRYTIVATLVPDPGASRIDFTIPVDCAGGEDGGTAQSLISISITLDDADGGTDGGGSAVLGVTTKVVSIR